MYGQTDGCMDRQTNSSTPTGGAEGGRQTFKGAVPHPVGDVPPWGSTAIVQRQALVQGLAVEQHAIVEACGDDVHLEGRSRKEEAGKRKRQRSQQTRKQ